MITQETLVAMAIQHEQVMERLGPALRDDLVLANPFLRRLSEFASDFFEQRSKLPGTARVSSSPSARRRISGSPFLPSQRTMGGSHSTTWTSC